MYCLDSSHLLEQINDLVVRGVLQPINKQQEKAESDQQNAD